MPINVVDTHIHVWDLEKVEYPWLKGNTSLLNRTYALEELEAERTAAGVSAGVLVQAANSIADTDWMLKTAAAHPWIRGVVGWVPLQDPEATGRILEEGYRSGGLLEEGYRSGRLLEEGYRSGGLLEEQYRPGGLLKGVRHLIHDEADPRWLAQDTVLESLGLLAERGISYDIVGVLPEHIRTALRVAEKWPELRMIFDHLNQPPAGVREAGRQPGGTEWGELMKAAAAHDRFHVKISGLGTAARKGRTWDERDLEPWIGFVLQHFGADRCCCGGDWPVCLLAGSYEKTMNAYRTVLANCLDPEGQEKVLLKNAERFYRL
jgi:L-fucono-1,5-lactonase